LQRADAKKRRIRQYYLLMKIIFYVGQDAARDYNCDKHKIRLLAHLIIRSNMKKSSYLHKVDQNICLAREGRCTMWVWWNTLKREISKEKTGKRRKEECGKGK